MENIFANMVFIQNLISIIAIALLMLYIMALKSFNYYYLENTTSSQIIMEKYEELIKSTI